MERTVESAKLEAIRTRPLNKHAPPCNGNHTRIMVLYDGGLCITEGSL